MSEDQLTLSEVSMLLDAVCKRFDEAYPAEHHVQFSLYEMRAGPNWRPALCCHGEMAHIAEFEEAIEAVRSAHPVILFE